MEHVSVEKFIEQQKDWRSKYSVSFNLADIAFSSCNESINSVAELKLRTEQFTLFQSIVAFNCYKSVNSLISCVTLCRYGMTEDAKSIVRKLIEVAINLKYVSLQPERHALLYGRFEILHRYKLLREVRTSNSYSGWLKQEFEKLAYGIQQKYQELKPFYELTEKGEIHTKYFKNWSGLDLGTMASKCELDDLYCLQYKPYCTATHASADDASTYIDTSGSRFGYVDRSLMPGLLNTASQSIYLLLGIFLNAFGLESEKRLIELKQALESSSDTLNQ